MEDEETDPHEVYNQFIYGNVKLQCSEGKVAFPKVSVGSIWTPILYYEQVSIPSTWQISMQNIKNNKATTALSTGRIVANEVYPMQQLWLIEK